MSVSGEGEVDDALGINWRKCLSAYIDHVGQMEGVDYLPASFPSLSAKEEEAIHHLAAETIPEDGNATQVRHRTRLLMYKAGT